MNRHVIALVTALAVLVVSESLSLAGNVNVVTLRDSIKITGDNANNRIYIDNGADGSVRIRGGLGTAINGLPQISLSIKKPTWRIDMLGGDDVVSIFDMTFPTAVDLAIDLGAGNDQLRVELAKGIENLEVVDGPASDEGSDHLVVKDCDIENDLIAACGAGNDAVGVFVGARVVDIATGDGDDGVTVFGCEGDAGLFVDAGAGDDLVLVGGLFAPLADIEGGPQTTNRYVWPFDPFSGDVFVDLDFFFLTSSVNLFDCAFGFEHEYEYLQDISGDLDDELEALASERGLE